MTIPILNRGGFWITLIGALTAASAAWAFSVPLPPWVAQVQMNPDNRARPVVFSKAVIRVPLGQPIVTVDTGLLCLPRQTQTWNGSNANFTPDAALQTQFNRELSAAGFKTASDPANLFDTSGDSAAEFEVGAEVTGIQEEICYQFTGLNDSQSAKGALRIDVDWQIYSRLQRKVVARISTAGGDEERHLAVGVPQVLLDTAIDQNIKALLNTPAFRTAIASGPPAQGQAFAAGDRSPLPIPAQGQKLTVADATGSVVAVFAGGGFGSGWVVGDGYVITNQHVVGEATNVRIKWSDGLETPGQVLRTDVRRDVALVKTDTRGRPALSIRLEAVQPGETVFAIGTPLDPSLQNTVTRGIVSAMRTIDGFAFIQSDVMVNHGNSGGPLLDDKSRVVGMTEAGIQPNGAPSGINLFIPVRDALDFLVIKVQVAGTDPK